MDTEAIVTCYATCDGTVTISEMSLKQHFHVKNHAYNQISQSVSLVIFGSIYKIVVH